MIHCRLALAGLVSASALPLVSHGASLEEAAPYLDLDGSVVGFVDFDGDGQELGMKLNQLYQQVLEANPDMPPIPLDFPALFETLGFGSVQSWGISSKELGDGLVANRSVTLLEGEPTGLLNLYGLEPMPFRAAEVAPADADNVFSGQLRLAALRDTIRALVIQLSGPMGQGMLDQYLTQPVPGTDLTVNELIDSLSGSIDFAMSQELRPDGNPDIRIWASFGGAGSLLARLQPLSEMMPITFTETSAGLTADLSPMLGKEAPFGLMLRAPADGEALEVFTHEGWAGAGGLSETEAFRTVAARLPEQAAMFNYTAGFDAKQILNALEQMPEVQPYLPLIEDAIELFLGDLLAPAAGAYYRQGDALVSEQYAHYSYKQALAVLPVAVAAGAAVPALQEVRKTSQQNAVLNNLRQIASAAQQHMLETGDNEVTIDEIVGEGLMIESLEPVAGESYDHLIITPETTEISVELGDGRIISYAF